MRRASTMSTSRRLLGGVVVVVTVRVVLRILLLGGGLAVMGWSDHVCGTTVIAGRNVECGLVVMVARVNLLQCNDTGNGQCNGADDKGFVCDQADSFHGQRSGDSHDGQQGGDDVTIALLCCLCGEYELVVFSGGGVGVVGAQFFHSPQGRNQG